MEHAEIEKKEYSSIEKRKNCFHILDREDGWKELSIDMPGSSANIFTKEVLEELSSLVEQLEKETSLKGLLITSAKPSIFIAGADINLIKALHSFNDALEAAKVGRNIIHQISTLPFETVAAIDGACLGGGMEFALACSKRIVSTSSKTKLALPEVKLGILPGFGGCIRLPRITTLSTAIDMILTGKSLDGKKAFRASIASALLPKEDFHRRALAWAKKNAGKKAFRKPKRTLLDILLRRTPLKQLLFRNIRKNVVKKTKGFYPAPLKILELLEESIGKQNTGALLEKEGKCFASLAVTPISKHLIAIFQASENMRKSPGLAKAEAKAVDRAVVLGAGIMGGGIAHAFSKKGIPIRMKDISLDSLALGYKQVAGVFQKAIKRRRLKKGELPRKMALVSSTLDYSGFRNADLVIEAIVENMDLKKQVLQETEKNIKEDTVLASNTSSLSITEMQSALKYPHRMGGLHFFSPVDRMPLVEVIAGEKTSPESINTLYALAKKLGKTPVIVKDCPGFLVNRLLLPYLNEAIFLLEEGVPIEHIDKTMLNFGMPLGPLRLADEVGLDTAAKVGDVLHKAYGKRAETSPFTRTLIANDHLGKKNGKGFYLWRKKAKENEAIYKMLKLEKKETTYTEEQLIQRMLFPMINEAAIALEEKVVRSAEELDLALIFGTGFPPHLGGLLRYADMKGVKSIASELERMSSTVSKNSKKDASRLKPSKAISSLANDTGTFYKRHS